MEGDDEIGAPAPQVLFEFCDALALLDIGEQPKEDVKNHILAKLKSLPIHRTTEVAAVFSSRACHDPAYHKVVLVTQDVQVRSSITKALTNLRDVKHYTAPAPPSGQEDEMQKWIEKLESLKDE